MIAAVIVLYHPEPSLLDRLLRSVVGQVDKIYVIDNTPGSNADGSSYFDQYQTNISYVPLGENKGIATAQNVGIPAAPSGLPSWIRYHRNSHQIMLRQLYNQAAIFLGPSWIEGWPLPPAEAMMCGAALVATDIGGHREYAIHGETALLSPAKEPAFMASNLVSLLQNQEQRIRLARSGNQYIQQFTWDRAADAFEAALLADVTARTLGPSVL